MRFDSSPLHTPDKLNGSALYILLDLVISKEKVRLQAYIAQRQEAKDLKSLQCGFESHYRHMIEKRFSLLGIINGLMNSDNLGDVHEELNHLCDLAGIPRLEGNFLTGWTEQDWKNVRSQYND